MEPKISMDELRQYHKGVPSKDRVFLYSHEVKAGDLINAPMHSKSKNARIDTLNYGASLGPHSATERARYTVPKNKRAAILYTEAYTNDKANFDASQCYILFYSHDGIESGTINVAHGDAEHHASFITYSDFIMEEDDYVIVRTYNGHGSSSFWYGASIMLLEFDA